MSSHYQNIREYLDIIPLIDCHDHSVRNTPRYQDPVQVIVNGYFISDCINVSSAAEVSYLLNFSEPLEKRWEVLEKVWQKTQHTGYAQVTRLVLKKFYQVTTLSLNALYQIKENLLDLTDEAQVIRILSEANIIARLQDIYSWDDQSSILDGRLALTPRSYAVFSLAHFHAIKCYADLERIFPHQCFTNLDEYLQACKEVFVKYKNFGAVAIKDNSAYTRPINYQRPEKAQAESIFNRLLQYPRYIAVYPDETKPLDDFLFHTFMQYARNLDLPVQLHTGQLALRDDIRKANAVNLIPLLELHREVKFDLFHGNWPYLPDYIYLGKNYPNVALNFCWANIIDPIYSQRAFKQAVSAVPHGKVHGYGSDYVGMTDRAWAHAVIARDNIARALAELVDLEYIGLDEANQIARCWLFENANTFFNFNLGDNTLQ